MALLSNPILGNYDIIDTFVAGIKLMGTEVKSLKNGKGSLKGSFITATTTGAWLNKANVPAYQIANAMAAYDPLQVRKLLLTKAELKKLSGSLSQKGLTALPLELYNQDNRIYLKLALVRHKNKHDKREVIKASEAKREIERTLKNER